MESLYLLIPLSVLVVFGIVLLFAWSLGSGQFDDLERQGRSVLDEKPDVPGEPSSPAGGAGTQPGAGEGAPSAGRDVDGDRGAGTTGRDDRTNRPSGGRRTAR